MCTGRVDISFILHAFLNEVDGVFIGGCRLGECNYATQGNYYALNMVSLCRRLLEYAGVSPERLRIEFMSSSDGILFARVVDDFIKKITELGPLATDNGVRGKLNELIRFVPYIKISKRDKLILRLDDIAQYETLYSLDEIERLIEEIPTYYIDPERCKACMTCLRKCPADAISGGKKLIHVIDQERCIRCGTCYEVCPPKFKAVKKLIGERAPEPLPDRERKIARKVKEDKN